MSQAMLSAMLQAKVAEELGLPKDSSLEELRKKCWLWLYSQHDGEFVFSPFARMPEIGQEMDPPEVRGIKVVCSSSMWDKIFLVLPHEVCGRCGQEWKEHTECRSCATAGDQDLRCPMELDGWGCTRPQCHY